MKPQLGHVAAGQRAQEIHEERIVPDLHRRIAEWYSLKNWQRRGVGVPLERVLSCHDSGTVASSSRLEALREDEPGVFDLEDEETDGD